MRAADEVSRQDIDVEFVCSHMGIVTLHLGHAFVPVRHRNKDAVRFRGGGQMFFGAALGQLERIAEDAIDTHAAEDGFLQYDFAPGAGEHLAAYRRVSPSVSYRQ